MPKGMVLKGQSRELVLRLREFFERENLNGSPIIPLSQVRDRVSAALCISAPTVTKITKEAYGKSGMENNKLSSPKKKSFHPRTVTSVDTFDSDAIRCHINTYYQRKEIPTLKRLVHSLRKCGLFRGQKSSLAKVLKRIGFVYTKFGKGKILAERHEIALSRCQFLRQAKEIDDWSHVVFIKETWLDSNHTQSKAWIDNEVSTSSVPKEKAGRLIICHAGTQKGFVSEALLAFKSKATGDYREDITCEVYENWFREMLKSLEEPSILFTENEHYNTRQINKAPTQANRKSEIIDWLRKNGEEVDESLLKVELLNLVKAKKHTKRYAVDEMAAECGHIVLRIPPFHGPYNAIEFIWAQVREYAAVNNSIPFSVEKMFGIIHLAWAKVTPGDWASAVEVTKTKIFSDWDRDVAFDNLCTEYSEELVTTIVASSDDSCSEEESDEST